PLPAQPFRVLVTGKDTLGIPFQRTVPTLFTPQTVKVSPTNQPDGLPQGQSVLLTYTVQNVGPADTFTLMASDGKSYVYSVTPSPLPLGNGGSGNVTVNVSVPLGAPIGTDDAITLIATSITNSSVTNSSVRTYEVTAGGNDTTPPAVTAA